MANEKIIWDYFKAKGLNDFGVAGLMGNLRAESGLSPTNLQNSYEKKLKMTDMEYTAAVDNGSYKNFVYDKAGYGLAQWTFWSLKERMLEYAKSVGKSIGDLDMQLDFLYLELTRNKHILSVLENATSVRQASDVMLLQYERPADQSVSVQEKRAAFGQEYFDRFAVANDEMDLNEFAQLFDELRKTLQDNDCGAYSQEAREWAISKGLIAGNGTMINGSPNCMWQDFLTREQFVTVLHRFYQLMSA